MSTLNFTVLDLDFPVGSRNKTATLITGAHDAVLVDAGFTRADGHRIAAAVLDAGRRLTTIVLSHGDPDFYFGVEVLADAFPHAEILATRAVGEHIARTFESKLTAWSALGINLPTRRIDPAALVDGFELEGRQFELRGGPAALPDRHYLWQPDHRAIVGGVSVFEAEHVWVADTPSVEQRAAWIDQLDEMAALDPLVVVPGHRLPGGEGGGSAIAATREYLLTFEVELATAADAAALTERLVQRYPGYGLEISAQIGAKVALGEITWG